MKRLKRFNEFFDYNNLRKHKRDVKDYIDPKDLLIDIKQVLKIHDDLIEKYGGIYGIRDEAQLESAVLKPYMSAFGEDIYPTLFTKVAALLEAIVINHPLADGNKRTAFHVAEWALKNKGWKLNVHYDDARPTSVDIINGNMENKDVADWLESNSEKIN